MSTIEEFAALLGLMPKTPVRPSAAVRTNGSGDVKTREGSAKGTEEAVHLKQSTESRFNRVQDIGTASEQGRKVLKYEQNSTSQLLTNENSPTNALSSSPVSRPFVSVLDGSLQKRLNGVLPFPKESLHSQPNRPDSRPGLAKGDSVSAHEHGYGHDSKDFGAYLHSCPGLSLPEVAPNVFSMVRLCVVQQVTQDCLIRGQNHPPDTTVTAVLAAPRHPLYGYSLHKTDVTVTYSSEGVMKVIHTPYIEPGIYQVIHDGPSVPQPEFPGAIQQQCQFIRCHRLKTAQPGSQFVILREFEFIPRVLTEAGVFEDFMKGCDFQMYTLPILLGAGLSDIWSGQLGICPPRPVCVNGADIYDRCKFLEEFMIPKGQRKAETVVASLDQYMKERYESWDKLTAECEYLTVRHKALCQGCGDCMSRQDYIACIRQRETMHIPRYSRKCKRPRNKSVLKRVRSGKRARCKSSAVERKTQTAKKSTDVLTTSPVNELPVSSGDILTVEPVDKANDSDISPSTTPSSSPDDCNGRSKRKRKQKPACDCPGCLPSCHSPKKSRLSKTDTGRDDQLHEIDSETRMN